MTGWNRFVARAGPARLIVLLGLLELGMAAARILFFQEGSLLSSVLGANMLIILPGIVLLYGGYRMFDTDLHPDVHPLIVARCLAGIAVMLGVVGVLAVSTGLNRPIFSPMAATALGSVAGFAIGVNEARAYSRAHEAEQARRESERRQDELQQERDMRERIVQISPIGIVIVDTDGSMKMANEHAARITGRSKSVLEALDYYNDWMFEATDADGNPVEDGLFSGVMSTGEAIYDVERQITRADGQRVWLSTNAAPLRDASGNTRAVIVAFADITERKESERRFEESNERLEQFAYAASHDLQEPLRTVSNYLQLIESRYEEELDEDGEEFIEFAVDGTERMREMIDGLLEYSRVESQGDPFELADTETVLEEVRADLQVQIEESDAEITADALPTVEADEQQLRQVFQNMLSNAIEYSGDEPPRVHVDAEHVGGLWRFSVRDEGIGIDPEQQDRIFEVFQRLHGQDEHDGTGIGLALCERIVERHGGTIWVESVLGEGTTFYFTVQDGHGM